VNRIVVGWDGSGPSEVAASWAAEREAFRGGHVVLSTVIEGGEDRRHDGDEAMLRKGLEGCAEKLRLAHAGLYVTTEVSWGDPYEELLSQSSLALLLVLGARQPRVGATRRGWSVGARLAATAVCPVVIVPEVIGEHDDRVVVGVDDDPALSADAATFAALEAERWGNELCVVHAWLAPAASPRLDDPDDGLLIALRTEHGRILESAVTPLVDDFPSIRVHGKLIQDSPARALLEQSRGAALLVIGRRGSDQMERVLLGEVSQAVVVNTVTPTIVVGPRITHA
jgi:nucleotide-binding universal stress UspA family protein